MRVKKMVGSFAERLFQVFVVELLDPSRAVLVAELGDHRVDRHGELTVEDAGAVLPVDVDVVLAKAGVDAIDLCLSILSARSFFA